MTSIYVERGLADLVTVLSTIQDRESLVLTQRVIAGNRMVLEAQVAQLKELEQAINTRVQGIGSAKGQS